jgi:peptidyl-prolyl cis-trans isomerase C
MVPSFAAAVRAMEVGTFSSEPVQTRFSWHVILLEERSEGQAPGLDAVRNDVSTIVEQRKIQEYLDRLTE